MVIRNDEAMQLYPTGMREILEQQRQRYTVFCTELDLDYTPMGAIKHTLCGKLL